MPILRAELMEFVNTRNEIPIRAQPQRALHRGGVPNDLYRDDNQCGFAPSLPVWEELHTAIAEFG
jgi:hypothetical protein